LTSAVKNDQRIKTREMKKIINYEADKINFSCLVCTSYKPGIRPGF
jgi:hypothetical protein